MVPGNTSDPTIHCTIFEDNKGYIDLVEAPRIMTRTKYIPLKYHTVRSFVKDKIVSIGYVATTLQHGDIFTKALNDTLFIKLRKLISGW